MCACMSVSVHVCTMYKAKLVLINIHRVSYASLYGDYTQTCHFMLLWQYKFNLKGSYSGVRYLWKRPKLVSLFLPCNIQIQ